MSKQRSRTARHEVKQICRRFVSTCNGGKTVDAKQESISIANPIEAQPERPRVTLSQIVTRVLSKRTEAVMA